MLARHLPSRTLVNRATSGVALIFFILISPALHKQVGAETIAGALARAYQNNPELNAARAGLRATNETVPQALSGFRPIISADSALGVSTTRSRPDGFPNSTTTTTPASIGLTVVQPLFRGFRTQNAVAQAEAGVRAGRASLINTEQNIFVGAAQAYMDVLADRSILILRQQNVAFLEEQVRAAETRFEVGEGTQTDVAQANARRAFALALVSVARSQLTTSSATYRQIIGISPQNLVTPSPITLGLVDDITASTNAALRVHPAIVAARANIDVAQSAVALAEGELLPSVDLTSSASRSWDTSGRDSGPDDNFSMQLRLSVPIYQGGRVAATVRQSIEQLGQARLELDVIRLQIRAAIDASFAGLQAARAQISSSQQQVSAAQLALSGTIEERAVGQRTTLDVLDSQEELIEARITQVNANRDLIVASYSVASALGKLNAEALRLQVQVNDPIEHYNSVRDAWYGLRTPDGRGGVIFDE